MGDIWYPDDVDGMIQMLILSLLSEVNLPVKAMNETARVVHGWSVSKIGIKITRQILYSRSVVHFPLLDFFLPLVQESVDPKVEGFKLRDVMVCDILKNKDELEDICIAAKKEQEIDQKLKQVIADWAIVDLEFGNFKVWLGFV